MSDPLVIAPILVALATVVATVVTGRAPRLQRALNVAGTVAFAVAVAALDWLVVLAPGAPGIATYQLGGWTAPFGITLVADALAAFMLSIAAVVAVYAVAFSASYVDRRNQRVYYHPLCGFLLLGVAGAFLTGDLFNLFVWFELMLMASYVFVAFYGAAEHTAAAVRYVALNVVGSALMLLAIGGLYATLGTLNMADMAVQLRAPGTDAAPVVGLSALLFTTFALKAGLVPFQFWVPSAYRAAPLPIAALLAGATKKVGVYAIVRVFFTVFGGATVPSALPGFSGASPLAYLAPVLVTVGALSVLVGGLGAVGRDTLDGLLAHSSIGQMGFVAVAVGLAAGAPSASLRHLGVLAGLIYSLHHALTKGMLFLAAGVIRDATGTTRLAELGGLGERSSTFAGAFLVGGLSLVGIPPLVGFLGKLLVFETALRRLAAAPTAASALVVLVLLAGATLTIMYVTRTWRSCFRGEPTAAVERGALDPGQVRLVATFAVLLAVVGVGFEPVYGFADAAATAALDTEAYVEAVGLGGERP